jgi:hypothetical protein
VEGGLPAVDEYSAPVFWVTPGTSSLDVITTVNGLPDRIGQIPFNSGSQALNWIASSSNYFAVGPDYYPQVNADKLLMYVDGNQVISYPTTGSTWYDLSGYNGLGTLVNGPTFNSNGWLTFDGADDYINLGNSSIYSAGNQLSAFAWVYINSNSVYQVIMSKIAGGFVTGWELGNSSGTLRATMRGVDNDLIAGGLTVGRWYYVGFTYDGLTLSLYRNGELQGTNNGASTLNSTADLNIATRFNGSVPFNGNIANAQLYSGSLSLTDIQQNYYGGPIVTDGLVYALDAGNLVSYPKSGTTAYSLTGSDTATLANGTGFSSEAGGTWVFDGADDQMNGPTSVNWFTNTSFSIEVWIEPSTTPPSAQVYFAGVGPVGGLNKNLHLRIYDTGQLRMGFLSDDLNSATGIVDFGEWNHIVMQYNYATDTSEIFHNGGRVASGANGPFNDSSARISIGYWYGSGQYTSGNIASVRVYSKALTADEVLQNYNATK